MNEQKLLFQLQECLWIERLWRRVPLATRRQILTILAETAKAALAVRASTKRKEARDER